MHYEIIIPGALTLVIAAIVINQFRHECILQKGFAGLRYRHGKFVQALGADRHIRWGRGCALTPVDQRQAFLGVTGREVLTADNVSLKASLRLLQSLVSAQTAGNTLVLGVPGGFVPLKQREKPSAESDQPA